MAQLGARLDGIEEAVGSNPIGSTISSNNYLDRVAPRNTSSVARPRFVGAGHFPPLPATKFVTCTPYSPPCLLKPSLPLCIATFPHIQSPPIESRSPAGSVFKARAAEAL